MQLFSADTTNYNVFLMSFAPENIKKRPQKMLIISQNFLLSTANWLQTSPNLNFCSNCSPRDLCMMTLVVPHCSLSFSLFIGLAKFFIFHFFRSRRTENLKSSQLLSKSSCYLDVLWGQSIKLIQVVSTSEFHEY